MTPERRPLLPQLNYNGFYNRVLDLEFTLISIPLTFYTIKRLNTTFRFLACLVRILCF